MAQKISIIGGGIVGAVAALLAHQQGFSVALIERKKPDFEQMTALRRVALNPASLALLKQLGCNVAKLSQHCPYFKMHVWFEPDQILHFDHAEQNLPELGMTAVNREILGALWEQIEAAKINTVFDESIDMIDTDEGLIRSNARQWSSDMLIAADGAQSFVRRHLQSRYTFQPYAQTAIVAQLKVSGGHYFSAWQRFTPDGPLGVLPCQEAQTISIVWSLDNSVLPQYISCSSEQFESIFDSHMAEFLGCSSLQSTRLSFPLAMRCLDHFAQGRLVYLGDAAHTIHPLAGQGVNAGLADVSSLFSAIDSSIQPGVLQTWATERRRELQPLIHAMQLFKTAGQRPLLRQLTQRAFMQLERYPGLKDFFVHKASV